MLNVWRLNVGQAQLGWCGQDHPYSTRLSSVNRNLDPARAFHKTVAGNPCIILHLADSNSWLRGTDFPPKAHKDLVSTLVFSRIMSDFFFSCQVMYISANMVLVGRIEKSLFCIHVCVPKWNIQTVMLMQHRKIVSHLLSFMCCVHGLCEGFHCMHSARSHASVPQHFLDSSYYTFQMNNIMHIYFASGKQMHPHKRQPGREGYFHLDNPNQKC